MTENTLYEKSERNINFLMIAKSFLLLLSSKTAIPFVLALILIAFSTNEWELSSRYLDLTPLLVLLFSFFLFLSKKPEITNTYFLSFPLLMMILFTSFAIASFFWSILPAASIQDIISLVAIFVSSMLIGLIIEIEDLQISVVIAGALSIFIGAVSVLTNPDFGFGGGVFKSIYSTNSPLAFLIGLSLITIVTLKLSPKYRFIGFLLFGLALFLTKGIAPIIAIVAALLFLLTIYFSFKKIRLWFLFFFTSLLIFGVLLFFPQLYLNSFRSLGKISSFEGRLSIWELSLHWWSNSPFIGYGWGHENIWSLGSTVGHSISTSWIQLRNLDSIGEMGHSHNAIIETALYLGVAGVLIISIWLFAIFSNGLKNYFFNGNGILAIWPILIIIYLVVNSMTTAILVQPLGLFFLSIFTFLASKKYSIHKYEQ